jgi:hypothetical protein
LTDGEKLQLFSQQTMIAFLRFLDLSDISIQILRAEKRGPIEPLQLWAVGIVFPVGAGDR